MAIWAGNRCGTKTSAPNAANAKFVTPDVTLDLTVSRAINGNTKWQNAITGSSRRWDGTIHYITKGWASAGPYGAGCGGTGTSAPSLLPATNSLPRLGQTCTWNLSGMPTTSGAVFILNGFRKDLLANVIPLPFDLNALGAPTCSLLTDITFSSGAANIKGSGSYGFPIPSDMTLLGIPVYTQALVVAPGANGLNGIFTNGGEMHIGR